MRHHPVNLGGRDSTKSVYSTISSLLQSTVNRHINKETFIKSVIFSLVELICFMKIKINYIWFVKKFQQNQPITVQGEYAVLLNKFNIINGEYRGGGPHILQAVQIKF